ncbi:hypothetical protein [Methylomonas sp. MgM2]
MHKWQFIIYLTLLSIRVLANDQVQIIDFELDSIQTYSQDGKLGKKLSRGDLPFPLPGFRVDLKELGNGVCLTNDKGTCFHEGELKLKDPEYTNSTNCVDMRKEAGSRGQGSCGS